MKLKIQSIPIGEESVLLKLNGVLVLGEDSTGKLRNAVEAYIGQEYRSVLINVTGVSKIDAAGLGTLAGTYSAGAQQGTRVELRGVLPRMYELLTLTKLINVFGPDPCQKQSA